VTKASTSAYAPQVIPFPRQAQPKADFPFTMIPDRIMADTELTPGARLLFGAIFTSCRRGRCYAGNEALATRAGLSVIQVRRQLAILEGRGLIVRELNGKSRAEIRVPAACIKKMQGTDQIDTKACIGMTQEHASNRCTELESRGENLEDGSSRDGEEIDPWTRRWFGAPPDGTTDTD
jgi:hypothetical protein